MPQMAPLNWLTLLVFFSTIFIILNSFNFYTFLYQQKPDKLMPKPSTKVNWKCL
uniref:ATP synthase complex subunit 8 n=1 Tax=Hycleus phaleratus TaxID=1248972 RepID=A0A343A7E0_9CUCU|nr:ATP synthase F0 subunit 8 [Hycleus phaleratus]APB02794.1 ATP synthase F0 subunit 8 [Hycleus phaleratus]ATP06058.1 ATP synthase F0 subunit 8 [Hycleus phaleratus]